MQITIENKQAKAKWDTKEINVPDNFVMLAKEYHGGDLEKAGQALYLYTTGKSQLHVSVRTASNPQAKANNIFKGVASATMSVADGIELVFGWIANQWLSLPDLPAGLAKLKATAFWVEFDRLYKLVQERQAEQVEEVEEA